MSKPNVVNIFPLCVPKNKEYTSFHGFLNVGDFEFAFELDFTKQQARLKCSSELQQLLIGYEDMTSHRLSQSSDVESYLKELKNILERIIQNKKKQELPSTQFYQRIIQEIDEIGWDKVYDLNANLSSISVYLRYEEMCQS